MNECKICYDIVDHSKIKEIKCGHELCQKCYINLLISECPFCRYKIIYTKDEMKTRHSLGIKNNPDFSDNIVYNPRDFIYGDNINNNRNNLTSTTFRESNNRTNNANNGPDFILSRNSRRRHRRIMQEQVAETNSQEQANERRIKRSNRRRKLSDEEIRLKRENINKRKQLSRMKKHGRLMKEVAWYNLQID